MTDHILYTSSIDLYIRVIPFLIPGLCALVCALFVLLQTKGTRLPAVAYFFTVSILSFSICFAVFSAEVAATVNILRGIFSIFTWGIPVIVITVRHFFPSGDRKASHIESESGRWITACVGAGCALLTGGIVSGFGGYSRLWDIVNIMVTPAGLILLTYYISEQRYPFARETGGEMKSEEIDDTHAKRWRIISVHIARMPIRVSNWTISPPRWG